MNPFETTVPVLERVTDKYRFIPTIKVIEDMKSLGYQEVRRGMPRRGQGLHFVDFEHSKLPKLDGLSLRIRLYNAHNGTAAFQFRVSLLNGVCLNVLEPEVQQSTGIACRIVHRGYALDRLKVALAQVESQVEGIQTRIARLQATQVDYVQMYNFAKLASELREHKPAHVMDLTVIRHVPQADYTAWNIFNRVQEALIRGKYATFDIEGNMRYARELKSISEVATINRKLWTLAESTLLVEKEAA